MPHRCVECKNILESGELDLNAGCPVCGGKKFQYIRAKKETKDKGREKEPKKLAVAGHAAHAASAEGHKEALKPVEAGAEPPAGPEAKDEKPAAERIESIRILEKGRYDLNLPVLLNRKELVMSREDGVYAVDLPSALKTQKKRWKRK